MKPVEDTESFLRRIIREELARALGGLLEEDERDGALVYFMASERTALVKIGYARDPERRRLQLERGGERVRILAVMNGGRSLEQELHTKFADRRVVGEWFDPTPELVAFIEQHGRPWP